jgi:hypothetical protein
MKRNLENLHSKIEMQYNLQNYPQGKPCPLAASQRNIIRKQAVNQHRRTFNSSFQVNNDIAPIMTPKETPTGKNN